MDGTQDQTLRTSPGQPAEPAGTAAASGDVFNLIADVEQRLGHLRKLQTESQAARDRMREREDALAQRERDLQAQAESLRNDRQALEQQAAALANDRAALERAAAELGERESHLAAETARKADELAARAAELIEREARFAELSAAAAKEREALDALAADLSTREQTLMAEVREAQAKLEQDRQTLAAAADEARRAADEQSALAQRAAEALAEAHKQAERLSDEVACWRRTAEELESQAAASAEQLRSEARQAAEARDAARTELEEAVRERDALRASFDEASAAGSAAAARIAEFEHALTDRDAKIADLTKKLSAATAKLREVCQALELQGAAVQQVQAAGDELRRKDETIAELRGTIAQLSARLEEAEASGGPPDRETAEVRRRLELAEAELGRLSAKLREARAEADSLREEMQAQSHQGIGASQSVHGASYPDELVESLERRHRRLQAVRLKLRDQARKVKQAGAALSERRAQVEAVLAQRAELAAARTVMAQSQRKLERMQKRAAKARVIAMLFYGTALLAVLGALSWALTTQLAPATYAARATLRAESGGRPVSPAALAEWQRFHESLLMDPQLLSAVADRMARRGITTLASPGLLLERLSRDLDHQSARPGELTIELRGKGAARATRELDTYVTALVSHASATVERRADGIATLIAEPANADAGPIDDQRLIYCAVFFGGGVVASGLCGVVLWRKLAAAKVRFEEDASIDAILNDANWADAVKA